MEDLRCEEEFREASLSPVGQNVGYSTEMVCRAYKDPVILEDNRVFENMLDIEEFYMAASNYFQNTQSEIKPHMRKVVTDWMLEVCQDRNCHADVFLMSCNMMDRFLSQLSIKKGQFQLVAAATIFIASKLVDPCPVSSMDLIYYTDNTYDITEILEMELLILSKLKWDLSAVTPYDFLEHLLRLLTEGGAILESDVLRRKTENVIMLCATEFRFSMYPPSMLSSAAIAAAAQVLLEQSDHQYDIEELIARLQILTRVENECLHDCIQQIENTFQAAAENIEKMQMSPNKSPTKSTPSQSKVINNNQSKVMSNNQINNQNNSSSESSQQQDTSHPQSHTPTEVFDVSDRYVA